MENSRYKFRAWDGKTMFFDVQNSYDNLAMSDAAYSSSMDFTNFESVIESAEAVEQFTGLQDKNGQDIYEGDIVQSDKPVFTATIEYGVQGLAAFFYCRQMDWRPVLSEDGVKVFGFEVIGNIHEEST